jgi:glucoamylase
MPLCWSHAEYVSLVRSANDGVCFDRVEPAFQRYVAHPVASRFEIWSSRHPIRRMPRGRTLRVLAAADAEIHWTIQGRTGQADTTRIAELDLCFADLPTEDCPDGSGIEFTFLWKQPRPGEDGPHSVAVGAAGQG